MYLRTCQVSVLQAFDKFLSRLILHIQVWPFLSFLMLKCWTVPKWSIGDNLHGHVEDGLITSKVMCLVNCLLEYRLGTVYMLNSQTKCCLVHPCVSFLHKLCLEPAYIGKITWRTLLINNTEVEWMIQYGLMLIYLLLTFQSIHIFYVCNWYILSAWRVEF